MADATKDQGAGKEQVEDPVEIFARAELAMKRQDAKDAVDLLRKSAGQNYIPAQVFLGEYLDLSEFNEEAVGWFMTAAYQGNSGGAFGLAKMYAAGEGIGKSDEKALYWFRFAAEKNHLAAVKVMANTFKFGKFGQKIDLEQAKLWGDKLPALEEAQKRESARKRKLAEKAAAEASEKRKLDLEEVRKKFLDAKELEEAKKSDEGTTTGEAEKGLAK